MIISIVGKIETYPSGRKKIEQYAIPFAKVC